MMMFWEAGVVLLSMPKTGSQALETALAARADILIRNPPRQKHMPLRWFQNALLPVFQPSAKRPLETIAVIREPLDWLGSWYRYRQREPLRGRPNSTASLSFAEFIEAYLSDRPAAYANVGRQSRFVKTAAGETGVDHLFAYENLPSLVGFLETRLGISIQMPTHNVSPVGDLTLPDDMRQRVFQDLQAEFEIHRAALAYSAQIAAQVRPAVAETHQNAPSSEP